MAAEKTGEESKAKKKRPREIKFRCRLCGKDKPLKEMMSITRFRPVLIVCQDCAREIR